MSIYIEDKNGKRRKFAGVGSEKDYIDDKIASEKMTWSSEKILDTLCPSFSVSGNPVTCNPVEDYPLSAVVTLEPKQAGTGDPSPDNIRPISGWDEVGVTRCGKNLLDFDGTITIPQNIYAYKLSLNYPNLINILNGLPRETTLTFSADWSYVNEEEVYKQIRLSIEGISSTVNFSSGQQNQIPKGNIIEATIYCGIVPKDQDCIVSNIQFESGSTATSYEPYQGNDYTLTLPETIYGGTVDAVSGVGSKTWGYIASYNGESLPGEWISDRDVYDSGITPTTGAQVAYKLAAPEPFQASGNRPLSSLPGTNTLYTDGNSLTVSGSTSPISAIESFKADVQASANQAEAVANILLGGA